MALVRIMCKGRINKPLPPALVDALPAIKTNIAELQSYAVKINEGAANEEDTTKAIWGNEVDYVWFKIDLAVLMPLLVEVQNKIPTVKDKIRQLKTYAVNTGMAVFSATVHICNHDKIGILCEPGQEI